MLEVAERSEEALQMRNLADELEGRLNQVAWNGRFYTHWVAEDAEFKPDLGVEMSSQVSLSNAYSLNRGISQEHAQAIIESYRAIRKEMPESSPGEFYSIYPPFQKGFGAEQDIWDYVNGGVLACTAGELARGCFAHGYEEYGADILTRAHAIARRHRDFLPGILRGKTAVRPPTAFVPLDLRAQANCDTGRGADGVPGWVGEPNNYLVDFPAGEQSFRGVDFKILSAEENGNRVCIGVSSSPQYAASAQIPVNRSCRSFYLLHASSGGGATVGKLTIHYADGSRQIEYIERGVNVGGYWTPEDKEFNNRYGTNKRERMQIAWRGKGGLIDNVGVWIASFVPNKSEAAIASLEFESLEGSAKWFVIGVTLSDQPPFLLPWSDVSDGMPNNWGAGCVTAALLEGLAGIEDTGGGFRAARISPRWMVAHVAEAEVSVRYPASRGYVLYRYKQEATKLTIECASCADRITLRIPLPPGRSAVRGSLNGTAVDLREEKIRQTVYAVVSLTGRGAHRLAVELE
jgi:hypothetical protein